jgi:hypothetical protein
MARFSWIRYLNPLSWFRRSDAEVVSNIASRAVRDGSTTMTEDECGSVKRWVEDYAAKVRGRGRDG